MTLQDLISDYGYAAVAIGTFFEGETVLVLGGLAAQRGYLELHWVVASAFIGTLLGDQLYFYIGRFKGQQMLARRPSWKARSDKVFALMARHETLVVLGFRFLYGLRTVTPFVIGASRISALRFLVLNVIGASTWAILVGVLGYLFGRTVEVIIGDIQRYEMWLFLGLAAGASIVWMVRVQLRKRAAARKAGEPTNPA
jgi:membrane protein DedA with SNARE-associated domain